ncbi:Tripartite tricarboxylate transporter TctB family protein [Melghirimyces thermohalophilus]|uniref:Tripartite tricarboxylate transporter TctB family protein n=1 Tax=Melghirimyces thermohalophilus TaxID=1236220 RepID=A0A1G6L8K5_9BACL|nr:tripartite tricarboxylate transporter TctB family protein [Melghirimyces thermohalophilus]SDC39463.1 Tripartite tricarboxylate transporter TctB family protein [Melghirimyces thermohalophilus]
MTASSRGVPFLLTAISLTILGLSFNIEDNQVLDPSSASFFPALIAILLLICSLLIWRRKAIPASDEKEDQGSDEGSEPSLPLVRLVSFIGGILLFAVLMQVIHFLLLSILYLFTSMTILNRSRWLTNLLVAVITAGVIYVLFVYIFKIVFPS